MLTDKESTLKVISRFMKADNNSKSFHFDELVSLTNSLLADLKIALVSGTREQKKVLLKQLKLVRHVMHLHYETMKKSANLSDEELELIATEFIAASPEYRNKILAAKKELDSQKNDLKAFIGKRNSSSIKTKSKWIRS